MKKEYILSMSILTAALILAGAWVYTTRLQSGRGFGQTTQAQSESAARALEQRVLPEKGITLPVQWGDLGAQLVREGVIDADKFKALYDGRESFTDEYQTLLLGKSDGTITITKENAGYLLNLFWALGLAQKNPILDSGEMVNKEYGGAENFASTGGWTHAKGNVMDHYSAHTFFTLTSEQQALVDKVSRGIYRPCCGNSTYFPDCNHGMAMLGLLELMASQGVSEQDMWKAALAVNSYWFPDTYLTIATLKERQGTLWQNVDPREVLGAQYSSASGYQRVVTQVNPPESKGGGSCGV